MSKRTYILAVTGFAFSVAACGSCGSYGTSVVEGNTPPARVASVSINIPTSLAAGQTARGVAVPKDAAGAPLADRPVTWFTSSASIASVTDSGVISAVAPGTTVVSAVSEGVSGQATMAVVPPPPTPIPVASVSVSPATASLQVGGSVSLSAVTLDANGNVLTGRSIGWSSANSAIATVSSSGLVTAVVGGSVSITASSEGQIASAAITVSAAAPIPVATVSVSPASSNLLVGATVQLSAVTRDVNNNTLTGRVVAWTSSNSGIASVNSTSGLVTAVGAGSATITATSETKTGTATIAVTTPPPVPVATVSVSPASSIVSVGATVQLSATTRDGNGNTLTGRVITWSSPNAAIASVNQSTGLVTAVGVGSLTITATSEGKTGSATINVQTPPPPPPPGSYNEPAGMTLIDQRPFNTLAENASPHSPSWDTDNSLSIVQDATAPISPSNVLRATFPTGFVPGSAPGHAGVQFTGYKTLYVRFAAKLSSNWYGQSSGFCKYFYVWMDNHPGFFFASKGAAYADLEPYAMLQSMTVFPGGNGNLAPNLVPSARIIRGQWQTYEFVLTGNSAGTANGSVDWYLDGVHIGSVGGIQWSAGATTFFLFEFRPIWGGTGPPNVPATQTMDWDDVYISGKN